MSEGAPDELAGYREIAERCGVPISAVEGWGDSAPGFPKPIVTLTVGPIWWWADVARWLRSTGRARPEDPATSGLPAAPVQASGSPAGCAGRPPSGAGTALRAAFEALRSAENGGPTVIMKLTGPNSMATALAPGRAAPP
jgi:hypothetical protein